LKNETKNVLFANKTKAKKCENNWEGAGDVAEEKQSYESAKGKRQNRPETLTTQSSKIGSEREQRKKEGTKNSGSGGRITSLGISSKGVLPTSNQGGKERKMGGLRGGRMLGGADVKEEILKTCPKEKN